MSAGNSKPARGVLFWGGQGDEKMRWLTRSGGETELSHFAAPKLPIGTSMNP